MKLIKIKADRSLEEGNRIRITCREAIEQFVRVYTPEIDADRDFSLEVTNTNSKLHSRLDITLLEGKRRYRMNYIEEKLKVSIRGALF